MQSFKSVLSDSALDGNMSNLIPLDDLDALGVAPDMHDWTFEQAVTVYTSPDKDSRTMINCYLPDGRQTAAAIRLLSKDVERNFSIVMQSALVHGFAIFNHKYSKLLITIEALDDTATNSGNEKYFKNLHYRSCIPEATSERTIIATHTEIASAMALIAKILGTSRSHLASACIMYSLLQSDLIAKPIKTKFEMYLKGYELSLEMFQFIAIKLT